MAQGCKKCCAHEERLSWLNTCSDELVCKQSLILLEHYFYCKYSLSRHIRNSAYESRYHEWSSGWIRGYASWDGVFGLGDGAANRFTNMSRNRVAGRVNGIRREHIDVEQ